MEHHATHQLVEHGGAPHIGTSQVFLRTEAQIRERLRFSDVIAFGCTLRNRFFRRWNHQFTVGTVEYEDVAGFRRGINHRNGFAVNGDICKRRLGRHIHIPQVVVYGLIAPGQFPGRCIQRHDGAGVTFLLWGTVTAPDIRGGHTHRQIHQVQLRVIRRRRPGVRRVEGERVFIRRNRVRIFRARIEGPQQFARVNVETTDHTGRFASREVIRDRTGDHNRFIGDNRRGRRFIQTRRGIRHIGLQIQNAFVAKGFAQLAGFGVNGEQSAIVDRQHDATRAIGHHFRAGIIRAGFVIGHATAGNVLEGRIRIKLRVEVPFLFTGSGIKREKTLVRGTQVKHVAHFDRRHFVGQFARIVWLLQVAGAEHPGFLQVFNVIGVDLLQRRITLAFLVAAISRPVTVCNVRDCRSGCGICAQRAFHFLRIVKSSPG